MCQLHLLHNVILCFIFLSPYFHLPRKKAKWFRSHDDESGGKIDWIITLHLFFLDLQHAIIYISSLKFDFLINKMGPVTHLNVAVKIILDNTWTHSLIHNSSVCADTNHLLFITMEVICLVISTKQLKYWIK